MFETRVFISRVEIPPNLLSSSWREGFFNLISKKKNGTIEQKIKGNDTFFTLIVNVVSMISVTSPVAVNDICFSDIKYKAIVFSPVPGKIYNSSISSICPYGALIDKPLIRIMVSMPDYKCTTETIGGQPAKYFVKNNCRLGENSKIDFMIMRVKISNGCIVCTATSKDIVQPVEKSISDVEDPIDDFAT